MGNYFDEYRRRSIESCILVNNSPGTKFVWVEAVSGVELTASPFEVLAAEYELNRLFQLQGYVSVNDFLLLLGYKGPTPINNDLGWSIDKAAADGWYWIDFSPPTFLKNEGKILIDYIIPPEFDYLEGWE